TMRTRRLTQANLLGPAGYVAVDDSEIVAQVQPTVDLAPDSVQVIEMGGRDTDAQPTMVTETLLRAFYGHYRQEMGL
ncbi:MAG TPA: salicylate hydroxylase, partial [Vineibacter sp.]|nr:salicylate hydroxylase [Vineibacter sp.]